MALVFPGVMLMQTMSSGAMGGGIAAAAVAGWRCGSRVSCRSYSWP